MFLDVLKDIELPQNDTTDSLFRGNICMIPVLSFVPVQNVILAFDDFCNHCGINEQPLFVYFETNIH